eukprot:TRINITY_DN3171_c0_g1_i1.p1 TRINITY_DN3171_c0_g1~~TRINITY_DN3171_c0_g1_i1.p1  ORF type:complete len:159 (+),score=14.29 TRINITY_DN3171_c0_g1_i1:71-547(+)
MFDSIDDLCALGAVVFCGLFAGSASYISLVEHPARVLMSPREALKQWKPSYSRAIRIQIFYLLSGTICALKVGAFPDISLHPETKKLFLFGAICLFISFPYTFVFLMPINSALLALDPATCSETEVKSLLKRWINAHRVRSMASVMAFTVMTVSLRHM